MILVSGIAGAAAASGLAVYAVGPMARRVFGAPLDFNTDYTSPEAMRQALAVYAASFILVFFLLGYSLQPSAARWLRGFGLANPLTIAIGFGLVRQFAISNHPDEYLGLFTWTSLSVVAPFLTAPAATVGARLRLRG